MLHRALASALDIGLGLDFAGNVGQIKFAHTFWRESLVKLKYSRCLV
jgi:hypothetical protein